MNKHSPLPWTVRPHLPDAHFEVVADAAGNTVGTATRREDAALIVEAVNGRQSDEALIAALLYYHLEDFAEAVASDSFTQVVKAAFKRLGLKYEPFGHDALPAITKHMEERSRRRKATSGGATPRRTSSFSRRSTAQGRS